MSAAEIDVIESAERTPMPGTRVRQAARKIEGVVTGDLIGFKDEGRTPLVIYPNQPGAAALAAGAILDLHGPHIGCKVVLMFENGDPSRPIIMGLLRNPKAWPLAEAPGQVEVDADGERLLLNAKQQLVLKCGKASITLTKAGKILIRGTYVSNRSSGVMRIKGGSVQLN
jgi:hypothetical protein